MQIYATDRLPLVQSTRRFVTLLALTIGAFTLMTAAPHSAMAEDNSRYIFADLADKVLPSVVTVYIKANLKEQMESNRDQFDQLREFFRQNPEMQPFMPFMPPEEDADPNAPEGEQPDLFGYGDQYIPISSGSGVILSSDGYILTNHHVLSRGLESATQALDEEHLKVTVVLNDGTELTGDDVKVIYSHPLADLALIKINHTGLTPIKFGDSDALRIGEEVAALGSPLDLRATVTSGIVGAKGRTIGEMGGLIQTNAVINPGSSGGPLVNMDGELVGINRLISSNTGRWQGYGFAIPSNDARWFYDQVRETGRLEFGYMGVSMTPDGPDKMRIMATLGIPMEKEGVLIESLPGDSPSRNAGLKVGDYIIQIDDTRIRSNSDLLDCVKRLPVGKKIDVTVLRQNQDLKLDEKTVTVTLTKRPDEKVLAESIDGRRGPNKAPMQKRNQSAELGLTLEPAELEGRTGLKVLDVQPNSTAAAAGLQKGDLLLELNRQPLTSTDSLTKAIKTRPDNRAHLLLLLRDGAEKLVTVNPAR